MSVTSGFFNSLNGDRRYTAEQFSELINTLVNDGVFQNVGTAFSVTATSGNEITVGIGRCWFNGVWLMNDALYPMALRDSELLLNRIDAVVIEINHSESVRAGSIRLISGTPASDPQRPSLVKTDDIHQYPLAYIYRKAGVNEVVQADITNMIGTSECPYITGILETQDIDKIIAQWESQFNIWFEGVQDILDSDTAAKLAAQLIELDNRFETLAKERAVYEELTDSDGEKIMDSSASAIQGRTIMAAEGSTASPNAITPVMQDSSPKVGDTLTTARTDLGDKWLLCNGETVNRDDYTVLSSVFPPVPKEPWSSVRHPISAPDSGITRITDMIYVNGYYIAVGIYDGVRVAYSQSPNGSWSSRVIQSNGSGYDGIRIAYGNGYYVVLFSYTYSTYDDRIAIAYTTNFGGTWTVKELVTGKTGGKSFYLNYVNGYFIATYTHSSGKYISYTTDPSGSWTQTRIDSGAYGAILGIEFVDGRYVALCRDGTPGDSDETYFMYSQTLSGTWTKQSIEKYVTDVPTSFLYANGKYVYVGYQPDNDQMLICSSNSINGPWTKKILWHSTEVGFDGSRIFYINGKFVVTGMYNDIASGVKYNLAYGRIAYSAFPDGEFVTSEVFTGDDARGTIALPVIYVNNQFVVGGSEREIVSNYVDYWAVKTCDTSQITIPEISVGDGVYTYIKAKE